MIESLSEASHDIVNLEPLLLGIWSEVLGIDTIALDDSFFELGGQSMHAVQIITRVRDATGVEPLMPTLFENPTVRQLAAVLAIDCVVLQIVRAAMAGRPVGSDDDLVDAGMTMDVAARITVELRRRFDVPIEDGAVVERRTPRELAEFLTQSGAIVRRATQSAPATSFLPLRAGSGKRALFVIPPISGQLWSYTQLMDHLDLDLAVYAARAPDLNWRGDMLNMREMIGHFLVDLRRVQPRGPYSLGGYSGGGPIAYELACHLHQDGERTQLFLFDAYSPVRLHSLAWRYVRTVRRELLALISRRGRLGRRVVALFGWHMPYLLVVLNLRPTDPLTARELRNMISTGFPEHRANGALDGKTLEELCELLVTCVKPLFAEALWREIKKVLPSDRDVDWVQHLKVMHKNVWETHLYQPRQVYGGAMTVFAANDNPRVEGWRRHCSGPITIHRYPIAKIGPMDTHATFFAPQNVALWAGDLSKGLRSHPFPAP